MRGKTSLWLSGALSLAWACGALSASEARGATPSETDALPQVDAVGKAKMTAKQGEAQMEELRKDIREEKYDEAVKVLTEYRDAIKSAHTALKASGRDAERKPAGFKELQLHLRRNLLRLGQTILSLPYEQRAPFEAIRKELDEVDKELINELFPRQPGKKSSERKPGT